MGVIELALKLAKLKQISEDKKLQTKAPERRKPPPKKK